MPTTIIAVSSFAHKAVVGGVCLNTNTNLSLGRQVFFININRFAIKIGDKK